MPMTRISLLKGKPGDEWSFSDGAPAAPLLPGAGS
jgi:hypothetical protein